MLLELESDTAFRCHTLLPIVTSSTNDIRIGKPAEAAMMTAAVLQASQRTHVHTELLGLVVMNQYYFWVCKKKLSALVFKKEPIHLHKV